MATHATTTDDTTTGLGIAALAERLMKATETWWDDTTPDTAAGLRDAITDVAPHIALPLP